MTPVVHGRPGRHGHRGCADEGSAAVEFLAVGVLLLVPLAYLVLTLGRLQAATFAAESGAREASRVLARTDGEATARRWAEEAVVLALADQGFAAAPGALELECAADPCRSPEAVVAATVRVEVALPLLPGAVPVQVRRVAVADRFVGS